MDPNRFDTIARTLASGWTRRTFAGGIFAGLLGRAAADEANAKKKRCPGKRKCGKTCCPKGKFCCDPAKGTCCTDTDSCCNPDPGQGTCCAKPNRCAKPYGNDAAPTECCPKPRQWTSTAGVIRCCPAGTRSLGTGISTNGGPCCPAASYCNGQCCAAGSVCAGGFCCAEANACGGECCPPASACWGCVGGNCRSLCGANQYCAGGTCHDCGPWGCGG